MTDEADAIRITLAVSPETVERIDFLARIEGLPREEMAARLLAEEAEAQAGLTRGPYLSRYMHR